MKGSIKTRVTLETIARRFRKLASYKNDHPEIFKAKKAKITTKDGEFRTQLKKDKARNFLKKKDNSREPNAIQRRTGYDVTPFMKGEVQMGKLVGAVYFLDLLKEEAIQRNITFDSKIGIKNLKCLIMDDEKTKRENDEDWNNKFFKPLLGVERFENALIRYKMAKS